MRRRILAVAVVAVMLAVTLFGVPLAIAVQRLLVGGEGDELERVASRTAIELSAQGDLDLASGSKGSVQLGSYDMHGRRVSGQGPSSADPQVRQALHGIVVRAQGTGDLVVAVPVYGHGHVLGAVRATSSPTLLNATVWGSWLAMLGLAAVATGSAVLLARRQARRLSTPIEDLEQVAESLGAGDFSVRAQTSGVGEVDRAGDALNRTAARLGDLLARERDFSAHASHQLRTPLTGLRLGIETALADPDADTREALRQALDTVDNLSRTVDDVLALTRGSSTATLPLDVTGVLDDLSARWQQTYEHLGRVLVVTADEPPSTTVSLPAVRQILDVLVDNALRHGRGRVSVTARDAGGALAFDVCDAGSTEGRSLLAGPLSGDDDGRRALGLSMARALAEGEGGRLVHAWNETTTRLTLLLPAMPVDDPVEAATDSPRDGATGSRDTSHDVTGPAAPRSG
ncbi:MAG: sensor histidine kinase [Nocardioidaceae bacterium]